jgi:IS5 family transposase
MLRTVGDQPTLWETLLPAQALVMPAELARVDALLGDERFFEPFRPFSMPVSGGRRSRWRPICG